MTQEFVTLPRHVAEHAVASIEILNTGKWTQVTALAAALRAALEQQQAEQPAMTPIAQRKLDSMLEEGYTISGYSIYHDQKHQHGFVTGAGLVGWWKPEGMEYPQPLGEQEPTAEHKLKDVRCECCGYMTHHREHMGCIRVAHTKREPLTNKQIDAIADAMPGGLEGFMKGWGWRQFARAVIEATHNIK